MNDASGTTTDLVALRRAVSEADRAFEKAGEPTLAEIMADLGTTPMRDLEHPERWTDAQRALVGGYAAAVAALIAALDPQSDAIELGQLTALRRKFTPGEPATPEDLNIFRYALNATDTAFALADADASYYASSDPATAERYRRLRLDAARAHLAAATILVDVLPAESPESKACQELKGRMRRLVAIAGIGQFV